MWPLLTRCRARMSSQARNVHDTHRWARFCIVRNHLLGGPHRPWSLLPHVSPHNWAPPRPPPPSPASPGVSNPGGRLPFTVPVNITGLPSLADVDMSGVGAGHVGRTYRYTAYSVAHPFGFG